MEEISAGVDGGMRERLLGLCAGMDMRLRGLLDSKRKVSEDVHEIRKLGKSLRGGLHLVGMPPETVRKVVAVGRLLAGQRDAVSRWKTWQRLGWDESQHAEEATVRAVGAMLAKLARTAGSRPPGEVVEWAEARIGEVKAALVAKSEQALESGLSNGVRRLRKRVCKRMKRLGMKDCEQPAFHEARKALKAWLGAQSLLREHADDECVLLADLLGDENDLSALELWLGLRGFSRETAPVVWHHLDDRHRKLRMRILETRDSAKMC